MGKIAGEREGIPEVGGSLEERQKIKKLRGVCNKD